MKNIDDLLLVLKQTRQMLAMPDNDFSWSSWEDQKAALDEIDAHIEQVLAGVVPDIRILYAPTGPIQEVSLSSGWGHEFIVLADRFDNAMAGT
jgi:hypothetical protein